MFGDPSIDGKRLIEMVQPIENIAMHEKGVLLLQVDMSGCTARVDGSYHRHDLNQRFVETPGIAVGDRQFVPGAQITGRGANLEFTCRHVTIGGPVLLNESVVVHGHDAVCQRPA